MDGKGRNDLNRCYVYNVLTVNTAYPKSYELHIFFTMPVFIALTFWNEKTAVLPHGGEASQALAGLGFFSH
jgi:hypothetical protein